MFEDVDEINKSDGLKRLSAMVISIVLHFVLIIVIIIMPLVFFNVLPEGELLTFLIAPPPPPKPVKRDPIRVGGNVQESKLIRKVEPVYPELAKRARVQGSVILVVTVDEEGNVADIKVTKGHPLLDEAAKSAVSQWKYSPTLLNGEPVPVIATVTVIFNLK
jgi:TonB family protein